MSNHTRTTIANSAARQAEIRRRCRNHLQNLYSGQQQVAGRLWQQAHACRSLTNQTLNFGPWPRLGGLQSNLQQLERDIHALASQTQQTARQGHQLLQQAPADEPTLAGDPQAQQIFQAAEQNTAQTLSRLQQLIQEINEQLAEMDESSPAVQRLKEEWARIAAEVARLSRDFHSNLQGSKALSSLVSGNPTLYTILENLSDYRFEQTDVSADGVEIFLTDESGRQIALTSQPQETPEDALLDEIAVEIDLSGFDEGEQTVNCDEALEAMLQIEDATVIEQETDTMACSPDEAGPSSEQAVDRRKGESGPSDGVDETEQEVAPGD